MGDIVKIPNKNASTYSSFREVMFEHRFIAEFMEYCWENSHFDVEVLHSEIDDSGYDLVISIGKKTNYLQLKITEMDSAVNKFPIHKQLANKQNAFILLTEYDENNISKHYKTLMPITERIWEQGSLATNSHNTDKIRENVRQIKRSTIQGPKKLRENTQVTMAEIFKILS